MAFKAGAIYGEAKLDTKKWNTGLKSIRRGAVIAGAAIAAAFTVAFVKSVKAADEFQKAMANVSTLVDTTAINMQKLSKEVLLLNPNLGKATELTKGLYQAFSAGAETAKEAMKITTDAAVFAKAALTDTFTAVDVLTTAVNAYGKETMNTTKASDIFFQTIKYGKVTGEQLASSIGMIIPLYASAGIKLEEMSAGMAAMTKQGINAHKATTMLKAMVTAFLKPSEDMKIALEDMGYASGSAFLKAEGLAGALKMIEKHTKGDAAEMSKLLPNVRALTGAMALTGVGGKEFTRVLGEMEDISGVTREAFEKQEKTFDTLKASIANLMIPVGNIGKHFVDKIAVGATQAARGMLAFVMSSRGMELVSNIVGVVTGGFELLKLIIEPLFAAIKDTLKTVWEALADNMKKVTGETAEGAAGMKILSFTVNLVVSAIHVMSKVLKTGIDMIGDLVIAIRESGKTIGSFFKALTGKGEWADVKKNAQGAGEAFKSLGTGFVDNIGEIFKTVRDEVKTFSGETEELSTTLTGKIAIAFTKGSDYIKANWGELLTGQEDFISDILAGIDRLGKETADKTEKDTRTVREIWTDHWDAQVEKVQVAFDAITAITSTSFNAMAAISSQFYTNQSAELELGYQSDLAALDLKLQNEIITQEEYDAAKEKLDEEFKEKKNALGKKVFEAEKKNKILGVLSDAASAIMGWWAAASKLGPFFGPLFAGGMTALTTALSGIQMGLIAKQQFVPAMAEGGTTSGVTRVNERGGEILNLPGGTIVIPNDISREIARAGGSSGTNINISFSGANISNDIDLDRVTNIVIKKLGREMRLSV